LSELPLPPNHRRRVATTFAILDEMLARFERWANGGEDRGVLYRESNTLTAEQRSAILSSVEAIRRTLADAMSVFGIEPRIQDVSVAIWSQSAFFWEALIETTSRHLESYGPLPAEAAAKLDPMIEKIIADMQAITSAARRPKPPASPHAPEEPDREKGLAGTP